MSSESDNEKHLAGATMHPEQDRFDPPLVFDEEMERKAVRKLDWHIIPMVMCECFPTDSLKSSVTYASLCDNIRNKI